jgi:competence protein CoiA
MKYAIVDGKKIEATPGARGLCQGCKSELIAKCGEVKIWHWAHKGNRSCEPWWENETEWHREWKDYFDVEWQEIVHKDGVTGETHIADVKTPHGWTIEIQHSPIDGEERKARKTFYKKIAWVVDGTKRKTDLKQLVKLLSNGVKLKTKNPTYAVDPNHDNRLLGEWYNNDSLVFFDFNQVDQNRQKVIWFVLPKLEAKDASIPGFANDLFIQAFPVSLFVGTHINGVFDEFFTREIYEHVLQYCKELFNIRRRLKIERFPDPKFSWLLREY